MSRAWIEEGLRHTRDREEALRRDEGQRHHWQALIERHGPDVMRALVAELEAAVQDYRRATGDREGIVEFQSLPREGFVVSRTEAPRATLQCRPDYTSQAVYCNLARVGSRPDEMIEVPFNLYFTVSDANQVGLRHGAQTFDVARAAAFLLTPVLFPSPNRQG
jgi:hypothetical protein